MNSPLPGPLLSSRLTKVPVTGFCTYVRPDTAPLRVPSPVFLAMFVSSFAQLHMTLRES